ncbi:MAG: bifunctional diaminohydroxyphosphoribosylaminopyrimidine, partial [Bacteroidota bacterium]
MSHEHYMQRCIELARHGLGRTRTNPLVGAVVVANDHIIGEGYHEEYGGPHAEVNAIASVADKSLLRQSTIYINLEPCSHFGKTPPCSDLIIQSGIPRVVYGMQDPFSLVSGRGLDRLFKSGIEVIGPIQEEACKKLNERFLCNVLQRRPWILLKWAQSQDGFMDITRDANTLGSFAISGPASQALVHQWRTQETAIMIGVQTAINDRP